jgi:hypothetical protein
MRAIFQDLVPGGTTILEHSHPNVHDDHVISP